MEDKALKAGIIPGGNVVPNVEEFAPVERQLVRLFYHKNLITDQLELEEGVHVEQKLFELDAPVSKWNYEGDVMHRIAIGRTYR